MTESNENKKEGVVYILQNPSFQENIIKIGSTVNLKERMRQLYSTSGVPARFTCYYARKVADMRYVERRLHSGLSSRRINPDREFFEIDPQEAKSLLEIAPGKDVTPPNELEDATTVERKLAKKTMFRLANFGIGPGSTLKLRRDPPVTAEVHEDGKNITLGKDAPEEMRGNTYSLSGAASEIVGYPVAGTDHWTYEGKTLNEIRRKAEDME